MCPPSSSGSIPLPHPLHFGWFTSAVCEPRLGGCGDDAVCLSALWVNVRVSLHCCKCGVWVLQREQRGCGENLFFTVCFVNTAADFSDCSFLEAVLFCVFVCVIVEEAVQGWRMGECAYNTSLKLCRLMLPSAGCTLIWHRRRWHHYYHLLP